MSASPQRVSVTLRDVDLRRLEATRNLVSPSMSTNDFIRTALATEAFLKDKRVLWRGGDGVKELVFETAKKKPESSVEALRSKLLKPKDRVLLHLLMLGDNHTWGTAIIKDLLMESGQLYPAIKALNKDGLIAVEVEDVESAVAERRPVRKYCRLTDSGREFAKETMKTLEELVIEYEASISDRVIRLPLD